MSREGSARPDAEFCKTVLNAMPLPVFVVDEDVRIIDFNETAGKMLGTEKELVIRRRGGEVLHCVHATESPEGCGRGVFCQDCVVRQSVNAAVVGQKVARRRTRMELVERNVVKPILLLVTTAPFEYRGHTYVLLILEDITELVSLRGLLPICAKCKRIRDDQAYWHGIETYLAAKLDLEFTHGLCPQCSKELFPGIVLDKPQR